MCDYHEHKPPECALCTLYHQPGPVFGVGDPARAKFVYIAQNPGKEEVNARPMQPLIGPSGSVFNRQLFEAHISRSDLFITNQVKCLTPGNREPTDGEIECCRHLLTTELDRCRTDTTVLAGAVAFRANIGDRSTLSSAYHPSTSIFERMGTVEQLALPGCDSHRTWKLIPTVHPAYIMRFTGTSVYAEAIGHLQKAYTIAGQPIPLPRIITSPTDEDVDRHSEAARRNRIFADDCEAHKPPDLTDEDDHASEDWQMDITGFSAIPYEAIVLDKDRVGEWTSVWADPSILQCEHNGESDRFYLEQIAPQLNQRFDTMLAHHFLHSNIHKYLKPECVRLYTNLPYYNRDLEQQVGRKFYNGMDCIATLLAAQTQLRLMKNDTYCDVRGLEGPAGAIIRGRLHDLYFGTAFPGEPGLGEILPLLEEQRRVGLNINLHTALLFARFLQHRIAKCNTGIKELIGPDFNWRSYGPNGQVQKLFYVTWGLPKQYIKDPKTHGRKVTCNDAARERLAEWVNASPERREKYAQAARYFELNNEAASVNKLREYITRISPGDFKLHALQKAHGAVNFRISSKPNTQNWPDWPVLRKCMTCGRTQPGAKMLKSALCCGEEMGVGLPSMRAMVIPDNDDDALVAVDLDQAELWPYAVNFNIKYLLKINAEGTYIYGAVYEDMVGKRFFKPGMPRIKKNMTDAMTYGSLREAKAIPLGFLYGMEGEKLAQRQGWPTEKGVYYRKEWEKLNPELYAGHSWIQFEMAQKKILRPPPGMMLHFPKPDLSGINCFGSTPAAHMLWTSAILINRQFKHRQLANTRITHTVHDSIIMNIGGGKTDPSRVVEVVEDIVLPAMTRPLPWLKNFKYKCSCSVGVMWDWHMDDYEKWKKGVAEWQTPLSK